MPAGQYTKGPQNVFARFRGQSVANYLGTCVKAPSPEHEFSYLDIFNDLGGRTLPYQLVQDGESARIVLVINRFDLQVCRQIRALQGAAGGGSVANLGSYTAFSGGTLVIGSSDFELVFQNTYAGTPAAGLPAAAAAFLNAGRRYYSVAPLKYKEDDENRTTEVAMAFRCERVFAANGSSANALYTETDLGQLGQVT